MGGGDVTSTRRPFVQNICGVQKCLLRQSKCLFCLASFYKTSLAFAREASFRLTTPKSTSLHLENTPLSLYEGYARTKGLRGRKVLTWEEKKKKPIRTCAPFYPRHQLKAFPLASSCSLLARHLLASLMEFLFNLGETLLPLMRLLIWCLRLALLSPRSLKRKKKNNQQQKKLGFEVLARFSQWGLEMLPGGIKFVSAGKCLSGNYQVSVWHLLL